MALSAIPLFYSQNGGFFVPAIINSMPSKAQRGYDYSRAGIVVVTLKARKGIRLCRITPESYILLPIGQIVRRDLLGIPEYYPQIKIGQYQIMPDHVHVIIHTTHDIPGGVTLQKIFRSFKLGVNRRSRETVADFPGSVFEEGMYNRPIFTERMLKSEAAYIRDNVRRYRLKKARPDLFKKMRIISVARLERLGMLWGLGDLFLLDAPRIVPIRYSRSLTEEDWPLIRNRLLNEVYSGAVFVSPFISAFEKRSLEYVLSKGSRVIQVTNAFLGERYKPNGTLFDAFCEGRVLIVSVAGEFRRFKPLDRAICQRLNEVAEGIGVMAGTQNPPLRG